jgi:alginate O-acetyltransferase complex protein AlgJ
MARFSKYILPVLFMIALLVPLVNSQFLIWEFEQDDENRNPHPKPSLNLDHAAPYPDQYDKYHKDAFSFRTPLLQLFKQFKFKWLMVSPSPEHTMLGTDGWYFLTEKEGQILAGKRDFSSEYLNAFKEEWQDRTDFLDSLGIVHYWYILPMKHYVYQDKLQFQTQVSPRPKRVTQLQEYLNSYFPGLVRDPTQLLLQARDSVEVYQRHDNHWNHHAGYSVAVDIIETLQKDFPQLKLRPFNSYTWEGKWKNSGFHVGTLGLTDTLVHLMPTDPNEEAIRFSYGFPPNPGFAYPNEYEYSYRKADTTGLKILIIRDSFGDYYRPFIKESFSESVFIFDSWQYNLHKDIILQIKPDIVLFTSLETHIAHTINHWPDYTDDY